MVGRYPMKKPKFVNVFGAKIKINHIDMSQSDLLGSYDLEKKVICIEKTLTGNEFWLVYFHECIHALMDRLGYNQTSIPLDIQEMLCEQISYFLVENNHSTAGTICSGSTEASAAARTGASAASTARSST